MKLSDKLNKIINDNQSNIKIINHTEFNNGKYTKNKTRIIFLFFCELCNKQLLQIKYDNGKVPIESWGNWKLLNNYGTDIYPEDAYIFIPTGKQLKDSFLATVDKLVEQDIPDN